ncbi:chromate transporter [Caldicoprobacter algeriensis]|uniref:chromate transporter n=1 Tax=Caldicoprobacter algeriensis TaxID=699281 RepID=UPI002079A889|nr:chromate transporter [Caldicoprobacter algeriensis]MCM8901246.1 chromate transporter [Caldicoprobacter algeriensis]
MYKLYVELLVTFFKIGLFTIGGGYAMIPLIQQEIVRHGWLTFKETIDIIAISEMTPGPFAINAATFLGVKTGGIPGATFATVGVVLPSFIIVTLVAKYSARFKDQPLLQYALYGLRPAVIGLIASAAFLIARTTFFMTPNGSACVFADTRNILKVVNWRAVLIFVVAIIASLKYKIHPILLIVLSGVLGVILYSV